MAIYHTEICVSTVHGELENVPVTVDFDATWNAPEPHNGIFSGYPEVTTGPEITTVQIGGWKAGRFELVEMCGEEEVSRQEDLVAEAITEELAEGSLAA